VIAAMRALDGKLRPWSLFKFGCHDTLRSMAPRIPRGQAS
jgi:hypothetical protein